MQPCRFTLDANILIYAVQRGDPRYRAALELVRAATVADCVLTLQALGEFFVAATRKQRISRPDAATQVRRWLQLFPDPVASSAEGALEALAASLAGRFSYWDALLLHTAGRAGCTAILSEDMGAGAVLGPVRVVPAFENGAISLAARALLG